MADTPDPTTAAPPARPLVSTALLLLGCAPLVVERALQLWSRPWERWAALMAAVVVLILAVRGFRRADWSQPGGRGETIVGLGFSGLLLIAAAALAWPWLGMIAFLATVATVIHAWGGRGAWTPLAPAWVGAWAWVALPLVLDADLIRGIHQWSLGPSGQLGWVLDGLEVRHVWRDLTLVTTSRIYDWNPWETLAGWLFAILTATWLYGAMLRRSLWRMVPLLLAAWAWTAVGTTAALALVVAGPSGLPAPWIVNAIAAALVFVLILSTDQILEFVARSFLAIKRSLFHWVEGTSPTEETPEDAPLPDVPPALSQPTPRAAWIASAAVFLVAGLAALVFRPAPEPFPALDGVAEVLTPQALGFPESTAQAAIAWREHRGAGDPNGSYRAIWRVEGDVTWGDPRAYLALDGPLFAWSPPSVPGWEHKKSWSPRGDLAEADLVQQSGRYAYHLVAFMDSGGRLQPPPTNEAGDRLDVEVQPSRAAQRLRRCLTEWWDQRRGRDASLIRLHVWVETTYPLLPAEKDRARGVLEQLCRRAGASASSEGAG